MLANIRGSGGPVGCQQRGLAGAQLRTGDLGVMYSQNLRLVNGPVKGKRDIRDAGHGKQRSTLYRPRLCFGPWFVGHRSPGWSTRMDPNRKEGRDSGA